MGKKSRYSGYVKGMNKSAVHNVKTTDHKSSIKDRINAMKEKSKKGAK